MYSKVIKKWFIPFALLYILLIGCFTVGIVAIQNIPFSSIEKNIKKSCRILLNEGIYPQYGISGYHRLDTQTDALTFNMLYIADSNNPIESAMINHVYQNDSIVSQAKILRDIIDGRFGNNYYLYSYSRNWHGYQLFIRPLLLITDFSGIKIFNIVLILIIFCLLCYLLWTRLSPAFSICYMLVFVSMNLFIMPLCMQYFTCISIAMISMIIILTCPKMTISVRNTCLLFFTIGSLCNFFDWLTIPQVTFGLPFIVYYVKNKKNTPLKMILFVGFAWFVGYGLTLLSKWTIGTLLTDFNCFNLALSSVKERMSLNSGTTEYSLLFIIKCMMHAFIFNGLGLVVILANVFSFFKSKNDWMLCFKDYYWLLLIACVVPVWYIIIRNHSCLHFSLFAWRALIVSFYSLFLYSYYAVFRVLFNRQN